jgi:hypothetical protein
MVRLEERHRYWVLLPSQQWFCALLDAPSNKLGCRAETRHLSYIQINTVSGMMLKNAAKFLSLKSQNLPYPHFFFFGLFERTAAA